MFTRSMTSLVTTLVLASLFLHQSCTKMGTSPGAAGAQNVSSQCLGDFGDTSPAQKLEAFIMATSRFVAAAGEIDLTLHDTCASMGKELGMSEGDLEGDTKTVCDGVAEELRDMLTDLRVDAKVDIAVEAVPPRCEVSMDAYAECAAKCDVNVDPGKFDVKCEGGEIVGKCEAECRGSCSVDVKGQCSGACQGTCQGGCTGKCMGVCNGTCVAKNADGTCNGRCDGVCEGTCSAGCTGQCTGQCTVQGQASCQGECHGGCSVAYKEPRCTGEVREPSIDAECEAHCDARVHAEAKCTPGQARMEARGQIDSNIGERVARVRQAIQNGIPMIRMLNAKLAMLQHAGSEVYETGKTVASAAVDLGAGASSCALASLALLPRATESAAISLNVTVSLTASATVRTE